MSYFRSSERIRQALVALFPEDLTWRHYRGAMDAFGVQERLDAGHEPAVEDGSTDCARPGRHVGTVTTPIGDLSASREPAGTGSAAAGSSVPAPPRILVTVSRVIYSRDSLSLARASRYSNRASSPRSSSTSRWAAASRRCNSPVSEAIGHLLAPIRTVGDAPPSWPASLHLPSSASP
jgi:hypothetical protein